MNLVRFQGETPNIYYEFDKDSPCLGEGGMGRIFQGYRVDTTHNFQSVVAIKCIRPELSSNPTVILRAQREASVQLDHPNLIRMYGFFSGAEYNQYSGSYSPAYYIAMERLVGLTLDEVLFNHKTSDRSGNTIPIAEEILSMYEQDRERASIEIITSVLPGIECLHNAGYLHRDLDPSNMMLTQDGNIKIIDFGICKRVGFASMNSGNLTQAGQFLGKVMYAAPELILGDVRSQKPSTDIYAVGIMLFQLLAGFFPAQGSDQDVIEAHLKGKLDYSAIRNKQLRKLVEKATDKDADRRYSNVREFQVAIQSVSFSSRPEKEDNRPQQPERKQSIEREAVPSKLRTSDTSIPTLLIPLCAFAGIVVGVLAAMLV